MFPTSVAATPFVKSGKVRALAVTSLRPSALAPGLPTIAASGLPGYESIAIYGMLDNECYGTTGGQPVPNAKNVRYDLLAKGAGYPRAFAFTELDEFSKALPEILEQPGPVFAALKIVPEIENEAIGQRRRWMTRTRQQAIADLRKEVQIA